MAFERKNGLIGINFTGKKINLVEVESVGGQYQINKIIQKNANLSLDFFAQTKNRATAAGTIAELINQVIHNSQLQIKQATFTLDSSMVLIKKVPLDPDLPMQEIRNQVRWEAEQFVFHPLENYVVDFNHLNSGKRNNRSNELLIVMVRKSIVEFLTKIFEQTDLSLKIIDVDVFAAIRAIKANYELQQNEKIALVDIGDDGVKLIIMLSDEYYLSSELSFTQIDKEKKMTSVPDDDQLAKLVTKELRRVIQDHKIGKYIEELDRIFLYGESVHQQVVDNLQNLHDIRITRVNPFRKVRFFSTEVDNNLVRKSPEMFAVSVGAALRTS